MLQSYDTTTDYLLLCGGLCFITILYLLLAKKNYTVAAQSWGILSIGLGGAGAGFVTFATLYLIVDFYVIGLLWILIKKSKKHIKTSTKILPITIVLIIILIKIIFETFYYGLDQFRYDYLYKSLFNIFVPLIILQLNIRLKGVQSTLIDFVKSGIILYVVALLVVLPSIIQSQLIPAIVEGYRITVFNVDTINSCRLFIYCIIFPYAIYILYKGKKLRFFLVSLILINLILVILNGTRQYLLGIIAALTLSSIKGLNLKQYALIVILILSGWYLYDSYSNKVQNVQIITRFSSQSLESEATSNRGLIWSSGIGRMFNESPLTGLGFRNFGTTDYRTDDKGNSISVKDNAHGFYAEVFIEHGFILGTLMLIVTLHTVYVLRKKLIKYDIRIRKIIISTCIVFIFPLLFSGSILNGFGIYYLALLATQL